MLAIWQKLLYLKKKTNIVNDVVNSYRIADDIKLNFSIYIDFLKTNFHICLMRMAFNQKAACINNNVSAYVFLAAVEYLAKLGIKITNLWSGL